MELVMGVQLQEATTVRQATAFLIAVVLTAVTWLVWLPWHAGREYFPATDTYRDAYSSREILGLGLTMVVFAAIAGWTQTKFALVTGAALALVVMFSVNAATIPGSMIVNGKWRGGDASLWPIGAALLGVGATIGQSLVAFTIARVKRRRSPSARTLEQS